MKVSQLVPYSVGIVAANKAPGGEDGKPERFIEAVPIETSMFLDGEITDNVDGSTVKLKDADGRSYEVILNSTATVRCEWMPMQRGVYTPPDVRRGMRVMILKFADADKYYWQYLGVDDDMFCLETFIVRWSGSPDENVTVSADSDYYIEVSTHTGNVQLHTSKSNNEPCEWDIQLNTRESRLMFADDLTNTITMESSTGKFEFKNFQNTYFKIEGMDIEGYADGVTTWTCPMTNWTGDWAITGDVAVTGNVTIVGDLTVTGGFSIAGNGECTGTFKAGQIVSTQDVIAPNV